MHLELSDVLAAVDGRPRGDLSGFTDGASVDSRSVHAGNLFVALVAERDGHEFALAATQPGGATAALVERELHLEVPQIVCDDTMVGLTRAAALARDRIDGPVIGITGSVGKTSCKDMTHAILRRSLRSAASEKSHNNEIGVPLTILNAPDDTEVLVVEMGARGTGHIEWLCSFARPTIGVVTTVGDAHLEMFGSALAVAEAKSELVSALPETGIAVLNAEVPLVADMARLTRARVLTFGDGGDVFASEVDMDDDLHARFVLQSPWGRTDVELGVRGRHNVSNALAAIAAALGAGASLDDVAPALAVAELSPWRMELVPSRGGGRVLNDAYNANPTSMAAALHALAALDAAHRVAYLGYMAELGEAEAEGHRDMAALAARLGIEVVAVGTDLYGTEPAGPVSFADVEEVLRSCGPPGVHTVVLVKGSRVAGLERLAEAWA